MARPTDYTDDIANSICDRIACGDSLAAICREDNAPSYSTVMKWLRVHEEFVQNYTRAREAQGDADADLVSDIGKRVLAGEIDPNAARVAIDAAKWTAGKRRPKKYGDKLELEHSGSITMTAEDRQREIDRLLSKRASDAV